MNIFEQHEKKKKRKQRFWFGVFYGPFLYAFALLLSLKDTTHSLCFTTYFCTDKNDPAWLKAVILYLYLFLVAIGAVYIYKGIEKLAAHKHQWKLFQLIFVAIPVVVIAIMWWKEPVWERKHFLWAVFFALAGIGGLILIETRPKK